jgi:hypothetical protein
MALRGIRFDRDSRGFYAVYDHGRLIGSIAPDGRHSPSTDPKTLKRAAQELRHRGLLAHADSRSTRGLSRRKWRVGDFFTIPGIVYGHLGVWRVIEVYGPDSPYVLAVDVTRTRRQAPGAVMRMIQKDRIQYVRSPLKHLAGRGLTGDPHVSAAHARWG